MLAKIGRFFKLLLEKLSLFLLLNLLILAIAILSITAHLTNRNSIKSWLDSSGTYATLLDESLNLIEQGTEQSTKTEISVGDTLEANEQIDQTKLLGIIRGSIDADFLKKQGEAIVDGIYDWLEGETPKPVFSVSLSERSEQIAQGLSKELKRQFNEMPVCSGPQSTGEFEVFEAECRPPNLDIDAQVDSAVKEITSGDGFFNEEFTGSDLNLDRESLQRGPLIYDIATSAGVPFLVLMAGLAGIAVLSAKSWHRGLKAVGGTVIAGSLFSLVLYFVISKLSSLPGNIIDNAAQGDPGGFESIRNIVLPLTEQVIGAISNTAILFSLVSLLIGGGLFFTGWHFNRKHLRAEAAKQPENILTSKDKSGADYVKELSSSKKSNSKKKKSAAVPAPPNQSVDGISAPKKTKKKK